MTKRVGKYTLDEVLGSGTYGVVYSGVDSRTEGKVAVKVLNRQKVEADNMLNSLKREITIMKKLNHKNIVQLLEVLQTSNHYYLVMEVVRGGDLSQLLKKEGGVFEEEDARRYFIQTLVGLSFCHAQDIAHRDLKPANLLVDENDNIKIADFGLANLQESDTGALLHTTCGSPQYVAPEVLGQAGYNGHFADVWSCGVILFVMLAGRYPFDDKNRNALFAKIQSGQFRMSSVFSEEVADLIAKILVVDPLQRITLEGIANHPWILAGGGIEGLTKGDLLTTASAAAGATAAVVNASSSASGSNSSGSGEKTASSAGGATNSNSDNSTSFGPKVSVTKEELAAAIHILAEQ